MIRSFFYFLLLFVLVLVSFSGCSTRIAGGYEIKDGKVFYQSGMRGLGTTSKKAVKGADAASFEVLDRYFGRDNKQAYYLGVAIDKTDGPTFELLGKPFQKDKNHVYYMAKPISDHPRDFKILFRLTKGTGPDVIFSTDGRNIFKGNRPFLQYLVDVNSFERIGTTSYFKDKNRVYNIASEVEGADPQSFTPSTRFFGAYATDKDNVFYEGKLVEGIDVASHKILDRFHHADESAVYFRRKVLSEDPSGFKILNEAYSRDGESVYWRSRKISDDAASFKAFPSKRAAAFGKDSKNAYWGWKVISGADVETFVGLDHNYAKDKNSVYFAVNTVNPPRVLKEADAETFALVKGEKGTDARDKKGPFNFGNRKKEKK